MVVKNAFKSVADCKKSKEDIQYERNTAKKQLGDMTIQRNCLEADLKSEMKSRKEFIISTIIHTKGKFGKDELWKYYEDHHSNMRVHSKQICGGKTHKGEVQIKGEKVVAHLTECGVYYKKWEDGDEESYYMKEYHISKENFTIDDNGKLQPIKKY